MNARHAAIVLAAGASRRLGQPKQLIEVEGETLLRRAVVAALATHPTRTLVVVGAHADLIFATVADLPVERIDCFDWEEGMAAALRTGVAILRGDDIDGVMLVLCDQPMLNAGLLSALRDEWVQAPLRAVASAYADTIGVPVLLPKAWFADLSALKGDLGARELLRARGDCVAAIDAPALARDIDTSMDLQSHVIEAIGSRLDQPSAVEGRRGSTSPKVP